MQVPESIVGPDYAISGEPRDARSYTITVHDEATVRSLPLMYFFLHFTECVLKDKKNTEHGEASPCCIRYCWYVNLSFGSLDRNGLYL